jgi:hypothetical protein
VIAIPAQTRFDFTESIPESYQEQRCEERDERGSDADSFAQIFAGLMQTQSVNETEHVLDALDIEKTLEGNKLNIFANAIEGSLDPESSSVIDLSNQGLKDADVDKVLSHDYLFNSFDAENDGLTQNLDAKTEYAGASAFISEKKEIDPAVQSYAALDANGKQNTGESVSDAADKKKNVHGEQSLSNDTVNKNEKIEVLFGKNSTENENAAFFDKQENNPGRLEEFRRSRKGKIDIHDLRTDKASLLQGQAGTLSETSGGQFGMKEISMDLRLPDYGMNVDKAGSQAQTSWEAKSGQASASAVENMLARELHQNFNGDIVRHAQMILRNGGEGMIKIALHPETLGHVKIRLEMAENKITGIIVVESEEALNAFRKELASLEQAFKDSGFAEASLDLSLASDGGSQQELEDSSFASQMAASVYEGNLRDNADRETVLDVFLRQGSGSINMLA